MTSNSEVNPAVWEWVKAQESVRDSQEYLKKWNSLRATTVYWAGLATLAQSYGESIPSKVEFDDREYALWAKARKSK